MRSRQAETQERPERINSMDAYELWKFLEVEQNFPSWIKDRITKYGFIDNIDFTYFSEVIGAPLPGRGLGTYALSFRAAMELAMVESNFKGRRIRQLYIECAKRMKAARTAR